MKKKFALSTVLAIAGIVVLAVYFYPVDKKIADSRNVEIVSAKKQNHHVRNGRRHHSQISSKSVSDADKIIAPDAVETASTPIDDKIIVIDTVETYEQVSKYGALPECLSGTEIDGKLNVDQDGHLIISKDILHLFEYFLSARNEEGVETSIARIEEFIQLTLPHEARDSALTILYNYLDYKDSLGQLPKNALPSDFEAMKEMLQVRNNLRREYMSPEVVEAFFADDEAYDQFSIERAELARNDSLSADEKMERLEEIAGILPSDIKQMVIDEAKANSVRKEINELKKQGADENEIYELREEFFGKEAADRLAKNDHKRRAWTERFEAYYESKKSIIASQDLTDDEKQQRIDNLKQEAFAKNEMAMVTIYERMKAEQEKAKAKKQV